MQFILVLRKAQNGYQAFIVAGKFKIEAWTEITQNRRYAGRGRPNEGLLSR